MRTLTTAAQATIESGAVPVVLLLEMAFDPVVYLASSAVAVTYGGNTYLGAGSFGAIDVMRDSGGDPAALSFTLSGVPPESVALALGESARNKRCTVKLAILNATTHAIEDVSQIGAFWLDQITINGETLGVTAHPVARVFGRPKPIRYTDGDQQKVSPGDKCLEYITSQSTHQDVWPAASWGRK